MRLSISLLGVEVFAIETGSTSPEAERGDATAMPMGFVPQFIRPDEADLPERG